MAGRLQCCAYCACWMKLSISRMLGFVTGSGPVGVRVHGSYLFVSGFVSGSCPGSCLVRVQVRAWFVSGSCLVSVRVRVWLVFGFVSGSCLVRVLFVFGSCLGSYLFSFLVSVWVRVGLVHIWFRTDYIWIIIYLGFIYFYLMIYIWFCFFNICFVFGIRILLWLIRIWRIVEFIFRFMKT